MTNVLYGRCDTLSGSSASLLSLPPSLLSLLALFSTNVSGQSRTTASNLVPEMTSFTRSYPRIEQTRSLMTILKRSTIINSTTVPSMSTSTGAGISTSTPITNDILPGTSHIGGTKEAAFKYYWLILAIFGIAVALFLWYINRRRIKRKEQMRLSGQNALARDMEGWTNTRRWYYGAWRPNQTRALVRGEEGLNEHGEAPPPYRPKGDVTVAHAPATSLSIPLRTLSRDQGMAVRPPEYHETVNSHESDTIGPGTTTLHNNRHGAADSPS